MNPNYCETITIYNCLKEGGKDTWWRRVIKDCSFRHIRVSSQRERTDQTINNPFTVRIPNKECEDYRNYEEWVQNPSSYFTVSVGDIITKGECLDEITGKSPFTVSEFMKTHEDSFRVKDVADNRKYHGKHIRAGG